MIDLALIALLMAVICYLQSRTHSRLEKLWIALDEIDGRIRKLEKQK